MARATTTKKVVAATTEEGKHPIYDSGATRDTYKKGDVIFFHKVRNWLDKGALVEAYARVVNVGIFEGEAPFIEVSFDDVKKMNTVDLGKDIRKFLLEVK